MCVARYGVTSLLAVLVVATVTPPLRTFALQVAHDDQVHYVGHLFAGRVLSLSPYTVHLAEDQYSRGLYHARTPRQVALLTTARPTGVRARLAETPHLILAAIRRLA